MKVHLAGALSYRDINGIHHRRHAATALRLRVNALWASSSANASRMGVFLFWKPNAIMLRSTCRAKHRTHDVLLACATETQHCACRSACAGAFGHERMTFRATA